MKSVMRYYADIADMLKSLFEGEDKAFDRTEKTEDIKRVLKEDKKKIKACLDGLNGKYKRVLEMRYLRKYSWVKISMQMYVPESTVRHWHQRGLERLEEAINTLPDAAGLIARAKDSDK